VQKLKIIKIGGDIVEDSVRSQVFLNAFAGLSTLKILVHGGGLMVSDLAEKLNIPVQMIAGRRITDEATLQLTLMIYAGLTNKTIVAGLQANQCNAIGLSGADANILRAKKREVKEIDYGFVGDIESIDINFINLLLENKYTPVFSALTHDLNGQMLNTNADTIAAELAIVLTKQYLVELIYVVCEPGVLENIEDDSSILLKLSHDKYLHLCDDKKISGGMIPKLDNGFRALEAGVNAISVINYNQIDHPDNGTQLIR